MRQASSYYPPNPANVPADLTEMNWPYFFRVLTVFSCLVVFVALYLGLLVGSGYLCYWSFGSMRDSTSMVRTHEPRRTEKSRPRTVLPPIVGVTGMISSGLLCLFLLKGFFKFGKSGPKLEIEVKEQDQPELFAFLRQLCRDVGAPMPYRVFLTPEVNAAVTYDNSILSLVLPSRKNLIIGLGLVNGLNLTELKAVLAHEFGHFTQGSMTFGNFVYQANRVVGDMVYGRDFFDDFLDRMQQHDVRVAVFAVVFAGVIWVLRKGLEGIFYTINFANSSLSRHMEFNADLVAVTVTGSDAIVHALAKLDFAGQALDDAMRHLAHAGDHKLYTRDLLLHQSRAAAFFREQHREEHWGEVPPLPDDPTQTNQLFEPGELDVPLMWATHPSNHDREQNAKRRYVRGVVDERSPWTLFQDTLALRQRLTRLFYSRVHHVPAERLVDPETVQAFIDAETAETTYSPRYHGMYDERLLDLTGWEMWIPIDMQMRDANRLRELHEQLYGPWLKALLDKEEHLEAELEAIQEAAQKGRPVIFRGRSHAGADALELAADTVEDELAKIDRRLGAQDRVVFQVHWAMLEQLRSVGQNSAPVRVDTEATNGQERSPVLRAELLVRYAFQAGVQQAFRNLNRTQQEVQLTLAALAGQRQLSAEQFQEMLKSFQLAHLSIRTVLDDAARLKIPRLQNMAEGQALSEFLLPEPLVAYLANGTQTLEGTWANRLCDQIGEMLDRIRRVHAKNVGAILGLHDQIAEAWRKASKADVVAESVQAIESDQPAEEKIHAHNVRW